MTGGSRRPLRQRVWPYLLLAPFFIVFALFFVAPVVLGAYESLFREGMISGRIFVGLDNYAMVVGDDRFWESLQRVVVFGAIFTPLTIGLALFLALQLDGGAIRGGSVFRLFYFLPYVIPGVVAAVMWGFLYGRTFGPINEVLNWAGIGSFNFLGHDTALFSIGNIAIWLFVGYDMIVFYAALRAVPRELTEAAVLDGASRWQIGRYVKIPMIMPVVSVIVIFSIIGTLQLFTEPTVLRPSAPDIIDRAYVPNMYLFTLASTGQQFNYVSAIAFVLAGVILLFALSYTAITRVRRS
jgi:multiple sugar transport system permease protein